MKRLSYWTPRILAILYTLLIMMFSLDVFDGTSTLLDQLIGFLIHNIPVYVMVLVIALAWEKDFIGFIGFSLITVGLMVLSSAITLREGFGFNPASLLISLPGLLVSLLYGLSWYMHK
ncbi:MAG TPA: hypothetical protein DIC19_03050 [Erysipelotrichaceae bacterium]|nr:hypothetical protein [Erysipelotrichaceae bacterium]